MRNQNRTVGYACIQGFFWMCYASIMGFASLYLLDVGFDNSRLGTLIAAAGLISAMIQPVVADYADRAGSMPLKRILLLTGGATLAFAVGLLFVRGSSLVTGLFYAACMVLLQMTTPLVNSLGVATVNCGERMNYGIARGFGSLGYALGASLIGSLSDRFGAVVVPMCMAAGFALFVLSDVLYPDLKEYRQPSREKERGFIGFLLRYPRYSIVLVGCILLFISHVVLNSFTYQIVVAKGGNSNDMGNAMAFASAIELPIMFIFGWMLKKVRCDLWFRITGVFFALKCLGTLLCSNMAGFFAAQLFQLGGWALITVSSAYYINAIMEPEDTVKGQTCYTMTITLGNVVGAILAGRILDGLGVDAMLIFGTACAAVGAVILLVFTQKTER